MCGILAIASRHPRRVNLTDDAALRMRDRMTARGPDDAGLWRCANVLLAHRRLAVVDPGNPGAQPMIVGNPDPTHTRHQHAIWIGEPSTTPSLNASTDWGAIAYNGELYNDAELRHQLHHDPALTRRPLPFRSHCDTETIARLLHQWGFQGLARARGMFALAYADAARAQLILARDPLGIKPLYVTVRESGAHDDLGEIVAASDLNALLAHPGITPRPDLVSLSAYLTTIRLTLGHRTLFDGVYALRPGEVWIFDLHHNAPLTPRVEHIHWNPQPVNPELNLEQASQHIRETLIHSVNAHLRSDVPVCALLSGGLDSSIIAWAATQAARDRHVTGARAGVVRTYAAGAAEQRDNSDLEHARRMAHALGSQHREVVITQSAFLQSWKSMVRHMGLPMGTPNEVAIHAVSRALRDDGCVVALSGEGADELFAGYEPPLLAAAHFELEQHAARATPSRARADAAPAGGRFQLDSAAWINTAAKPALLNESLWHAVDRDQALHDFYEGEFRAAQIECKTTAETDPLAPHLVFQRRINLTGLLQRLDTATMLAGVEGRTPFADVRVLEAASGVAMSHKFDLHTHRDADSLSDAARAARSKRVLRHAFRDVLPHGVVSRAKASFPLPFEQWMGDDPASADTLARSAMLRELFNDAAVATVAAAPARHWRLAWPMLNVALWAERWWP